MNGILNINKPVGMTSFDVVKKVKTILNIKKVGHTGTLDPGASGVLPVCIGRATKLVDYIMQGRKTYIAELRLGIATDTYDKYGNIISKSDVNIDQNQLIDTISSFIGNIKQIPPMYSALKVNGKRLYDLARQGIEIERKSRDITIYNIDIMNINIPYVKLKVECSKGTYIRSLCYDIGKSLSCGGAMWSLVRTHTGEFDILNSISINDLNNENVLQHIIPMDKALNKCPKVFVKHNFKNNVLNGIPIYDEEFLKYVNPDEIYRVYIDRDQFIGIGMNNGNTGFKMIKLLIRGN